MEIYFTPIELKNVLDFQISVDESNRCQIDNIMDDLFVIQGKNIPLTRTKVPLTKEVYDYIEKELSKLIPNWIDKWASEGIFDHLSGNELENKIKDLVHKQFKRTVRPLKTIQNTANDMIEKTIKRYAVNDIVNYVDTLYPERHPNLCVIHSENHKLPVYYLLNEQDVYVYLNDFFPQGADLNFSKKGTFYCGAVSLNYPEDIYYVDYPEDIIVMSPFDKGRYPLS